MDSKNIKCFGILTIEFVRVAIVILASCQKHEFHCPEKFMSFRYICISFFPYIVSYLCDSDNHFFFLVCVIRYVLASRSSPNNNNEKRAKFLCAKTDTISKFFRQLWCIYYHTRTSEKKEIKKTDDSNWCTTTTTIIIPETMFSVCTMHESMMECQLNDNIIWLTDINYWRKIYKKSGKHILAIYERSFVRSPFRRTEKMRENASSSRMSILVGNKTKPLSLSSPSSSSFGSFKYRLYSLCSSSELPSAKKEENTKRRTQPKHHQQPYVHFQPHEWKRSLIQAFVYAIEINQVS